MPIEPSGMPVCSAAAESTRAIAAHERAAIDPPRKMQAFPDFRQMPAASAVTFGRASYTTATTPKGTLTRSRRIPDSRVRCSSVRPSGLGSSARLSSAAAMSSMRASVRSNRSMRLSFVPFSRAAATSAAFALRTAGALSRSACAMARRAPLRPSSLVWARRTLAARARLASISISSYMPEPFSRPFPSVIPAH